MKPTYEELEAFARWAQAKQSLALDIMDMNNIVLDDLKDPIQKLAFTFYTELVEIESRVRDMFGEE
jgi:hypothetical protein